jgi:hypothetical protein
MNPQWRRLTTLAAYLVGVSSQFLLEPAIIDPNHRTGLIPFVLFATAITSGLILFWTGKLRKRKSIPRWWTAAMISFLITISAYCSYSELKRRWTCDLYGHSFVIGEPGDLTEPGRSAAKQIGFTDPTAVPPQRILREFESSDQVWNSSVLYSRKRKLDALYFLCSILVASTIIILAEAILPKCTD